MIKSSPLAWAMHRRQRVNVLLGLIGFIAVCHYTLSLFSTNSYPQNRNLSIVTNTPEKPAGFSHKGERPTKALVVASMSSDDTSWIQDNIRGWQINRYIGDSEISHPRVPKNKGREAMVYLSYMIDYYDTLPDVMVFMHSQRYQWHNDDPLYDGVPVLQNLQIPYVLSQGYVNLRCVWILGCPAELQLAPEIVNSPGQASQTTQLEYGKAFGELFPNETLPMVVGVSCCGQFALTREKVRSRSREEYIHWRQWLLETPLDDAISGRIFEYSWHIIFGKEAVHCPNAKECYCNVFGLCNLDCGEEGTCGNRWVLPPSSTLPQGWPARGWNGESQDEATLARLRNSSMSPT
ncbi:hypothetical protein HYFRA_00011455 [Hymenoscyphus fraxineus]|uniref:DUF3431 domain containing protein n=1 Tax=Hymenoscyphus fraxineus TaxID=746836 RepID=A0A9N9L1N9_9HELO|nr:hypothetical protein HYFRA_00011455 [Hymenoscyphus fraxineus]